MFMQPVPTLTLGLFALIQALLLLALTPLMTGISRQIRALMHSRRGPGIWQDYRDIAKLLKRQDLRGRGIDSLPSIRTQDPAD